MLTNTSRSPTLACHRSGGDCRLQVRRGHAHAKIQASATRQGTRDIPSTGEVANNDLGADRSQCTGTFIVAPDKRANWQVTLAKHLHHSATHSAYAASSTCDKDRNVNRHQCSFNLGGRGA